MVVVLCAFDAIYKITYIKSCWKIKLCSRYFTARMFEALCVLFLQLCIYVAALQSKCWCEWWCVERGKTSRATNAALLYKELPQDKVHVFSLHILPLILIICSNLATSLNHHNYSLMSATTCRYILCFNLHYAHMYPTATHQIATALLVAIVSPP